MKLFGRKKNDKKDIFIPDSNNAKCIYGPPEMLFARKNNVPVDIYGPPETDISENETDNDEGEDKE